MPDSSVACSLVIHPGSLGDVLLSLPALRALRAADPAKPLVLVARGEVASLLKECEEVTHVLPLEQRAFADCVSGVGRWEVELSRRGLARCNLAICWMRDPDDRLRCSLERAGVHTVVIESPHAPSQGPMHQSDRFFETVRSMVPKGPLKGSLELPERLVLQGRLHLQTLVSSTNSSRAILHPGSGSRHKCCRPELLADLSVRLRELAMTTVLLEGPADAELVEEVRKICGKETPIVQHATLEAVAALLTAADLFLGHDSGITHLAAAVGVPTVALFGPTDSQRWAPRGAHVVAVSGERCACETWERVQTCDTKPCLQIPVDRVVTHCRRLMQRDHTARDIGKRQSA